MLYLHKFKHQPEIVATSETKVQDNSVHINFQLDGYDFVYVGSLSKAGKVEFFVKYKINFITLDDIELNFPCEDDLWIKINGKPKLVVEVIYQHPKQTVVTIDEFSQTLHETLNKMNWKSQTFYVVRDFNVDLLKNDRDNNVCKYAILLLISDCKCGVDVLTRTIDPTNSLLDHIYTNEMRSDKLKFGIMKREFSNHDLTFP